MHKKLNYWLALVFIFFLPVSLHAQTGADTIINKNTAVEFKNDTLFYSNGLKIYVGQKLILGNAASYVGKYRSIISKKAALVPSIWGQDKSYENAIENYVDSKKDKEKVKKSLIAGNQLTITKIWFQKTGRPYCYLASLFSGTNNYTCDVKLALILKELLLQQESTYPRWHLAF